MTATVPSIEPTACVAGDSLTWTFIHPDYLTPIWTPSYAVLGVDKITWNPAWVTATPDGGSTIFVPMTATANLHGGSYRFTRFTTDGTTRMSWELPPLNIADNPALIAAGTTRVAQLEADYAALNAAISGRLTGDEPEEYTIGGLSVKKLTLLDLQNMRTTVQHALWRARHPGQVRQHVVHFNRQVT